MIAIKMRNVNGLYAMGLETLAQCGLRQKSRAGDVLVVPYPVMSVYENPTERVLFDESRDANPFFHLMEALWMLAGRDDAGFLNHYVKDFGARFAEEGDVMHGAYGFRWREELGFDQLDAVVEKLRKNPDDRQAVIQMWDARAGYYGGGFGSSGPDFVGRDDLNGTWRDRPCNTHVYLRVRRTETAVGLELPTFPVTHSAHVLDLTVCCRSNDIVWGAYGSNAVHFSVLQEYLAGRIGVGVGTMYQLSNNWHGYVDVLDKLGEPQEARDLYDTGVVHSVAMGTDWNYWDVDLVSFMRWHSDVWERGSVMGYPEGYGPPFPLFRNAWFRDACLMAFANYQRVSRKDMMAALSCARKIMAPDWRMACTEWLERRIT